MSFFKKEISTTKGLIAIFGAAVVLFGAAMTCYVRMAPTTYDYEIQGSTVIKKTAATTVDDTKDWKTYTNTAKGYSIKYPADWTQHNNTDDSNISIRQNQVNYSLGIVVVSSQLSLDDYILSLKTAATKLINNNQPGDTFGNETKTMIGEQSAIKITNCTQSASAYKYDWYFVKKDSNIYKISITKVVGEGTVFNSAPYISTAETMLSTFKFITPTSTTTTTPVTTTTAAAWKSYQNTDYGFGLTFTDAWEGYKMKAVDLEGTVKTFYVNVPTKDPLNASETSTSYAGYAAPFAIGVIEKSKWQDDELFARDFGSKVGEKGDYIFTSSQWQACPTDLCSGDIASSLKTVMDSFTVL
jgi:hypothetical protein